MAISSSSSSSSSDKEVQNCSKQCLESFKTLQKNFDSEREKHSRARLEIQGYELALESLESRILGHEKNELAWGEKYEFQNYELKCREVKIDNLKMELEKVVKERDELKVKIEKWEESSKGLNKILNSQMSAKDKNGLGYGTQLDEMSNKSETDSAISLDEYAIRKKIIESKPSEPKDDTSESKTSETRAVHTISTARPISIARPVSTARPFAPKIARTSSAIRPIYPRMENVRPRASYSPIKRFYYTKPAVRPKDIKQDVKTFGVKNMTTAGTRVVVNTSKGKMDNALKDLKEGNPEICLQDHAVVDSGCSSHMTGNKAYLSDYEDYNGGFVAFRSDPKEVNVDACTQEHYVAGSSEKDKEPTQEYILLPLHPHRPRISVEDVVQAAQEKPSENSPKDNDVQDSEDVAKKEEQHTLTEAEQTLKDDLERMIAQEIAAKAIYDVIRQAFEEEKKRASSCYHTANTSYASAASTPTGANTGGSSFVYLGGQIPIDASTLPNADLPIDPNMPDLEDDSNADFNNMNNTIDVSPIPTLRVHKDHPKGQILGDPKLAVQTRGKIQKASSVQQALNVYPSLIGWKAGLKAMQEELLQYKLQKSMCTEFEDCMHKRFQMRSMGELTFFLGLQVKQQPDGIFISQDKYLKHQPKLGLWYPRDSPFELEAFSDSDYGGASLDRKSTTGGSLLGMKTEYLQCKNQCIIMANSTTEAEYVAAANCCGQVLWIQNQMMDYGFNFMNTKIHIDNESTICIVKNPVYHSRTKHIEIRHHFLQRDLLCTKYRLDVIKIHS
ncbi:hypothetical protein Tco_1069487 [Tanacetum coccineum]|uniref:Uncharacterized protein n=2 Tax=Tanacetum coccineum TaxID=301880 RepID=A0ABQ5HIN0_9ASTR